MKKLVFTNLIMHIQRVCFKFSCRKITDTFNIPHFVELLGVLNYANTDLKIFLYVCLDIKIISCKFRVPNLKNF